MIFLPVRVRRPDDTRSYDYMLHPIFAPLFNFSYRRKRKMLLTHGELLLLSRRSRPTINRLLARHNRQPIESQAQGDLF